MGRVASEKTQLTSLRREFNALSGELVRARDECAKYRIRATQAETLAAQWQARFDLLLSKLKAVEVNP